MFHTVSIQDHADPVLWSEIAKFRWHADAIEYARSISGSDRWGGVVQIKSDRDYVNVYYRRGKEVLNELYA
jgi:hypothetical protein